MCHARESSILVCQGTNTRCFPSSRISLGANFSYAETKFCMSSIRHCRRDIDEIIPQTIYFPVIRKVFSQTAMKKVCAFPRTHHLRMKTNKVCKKERKKIKKRGKKRRKNRKKGRKSDAEQPAKQKKNKLHQQQEHRDHLNSLYFQLT